MLQAQESVGTHAMTGITVLSGQAGGSSEQMRKNKKNGVIFPPVTYGHQVMPAKGAEETCLSGQPESGGSRILPSPAPELQAGGGGVSAGLLGALGRSKNGVLEDGRAVSSSRSLDETRVCEREE